MILKHGSIVLLILFGATECLAQESDTLKCWQASSKLVWADFHAKAVTDGPGATMRAATSSVVRVVPVQNENMVTYRVKVDFNRKKSWTRDSTQYILSHEQLHFDIAELYARRLRKSLKEMGLKPAADSKVFKPLIEKAISSLHDRQAEYDRETNHGIDKEKQASAAAKIYKEMKALEVFATKEKDCE